MMPFLAGQVTAKIATKNCVRYEVVVKVTL